MARTIPTVLLTRPEAQSRALADLLRARAGSQTPIVIAPLMRIESIPAAWDRAAPVLLFTSQQGVAEYRAQGGAGGGRAFCVGDSTARAAEAAGLQATSAGGTVEDLLRLLIARRPAGPLLHLRGAHARGNLAQRLCDAGLQARECVVYTQQDVAPGDAARALFAAQAPVLAPIYSPRSALRFAREFAPAPSAHLLCMSEFVQQNLEPDAFGRIDVIAQPDGATMVESVLRILLQASQG